jgi:hypothetical protein
MQNAEFRRDGSAFVILRRSSFGGQETSAVVKTLVDRMAGQDGAKSPPSLSMAGLPPSLKRNASATVCRYGSPSRLRVVLAGTVASARRPYLSPARCRARASAVVKTTADRMAGQDFGGTGRGKTQADEKRVKSLAVQGV